MSSLSPGMTLETRPQGEIQISALSKPTNQHAIATLRKLVLSSMGPSGHLKMTHNNVGGQVTVTSSSGRLFGAISSHNPFLRLILTAAQGHLQKYSDGGLQVAALALSLVQHSLCEQLHPRLLADIYHFLTDQCLIYLEQKDCPCKFKLDINDLNQMTGLVRCTINKPGCGFVAGDCDHVCRVILSAVLRVYPSESHRQYGIIHYLPVEGMGIRDSYMSEGILFDTPQISTYRKRPLGLLKASAGDHEGWVKVAVFNISLSGDIEDHEDALYETHDGVDPAAVAVEILQECVEHLVALGVGLLLCQKVVHPSIKASLRRQGVWVLDRLGAKYIAAAHTLTGGMMLGTVSARIRAQDLGWIQDMTHHVIQGRSYVQLTHPSHPVCTVVLGNRSEEALQEMRYVCSSAEHTLKMALQDPTVLMGGGCWQSHLTAYLKQQVKINLSEWSKTMDCTQSQLMTAAKTFTLCLEEVVMATEDSVDHVTDNVSHHHWVFPQNTIIDSDWSKYASSCVCGSVRYNKQMYYTYIGKEDESSSHPEIDRGTGECESSKCTVVDYYPTMMNTLTTAVAIGSAVITICHTITDPT